MHCPFKEKRAKMRREATISYYSQQPCPPQSHDNMFLLQAILLPLTDKSTRSMHYEAESHFAEVQDSWAGRGPVFYRTSEPTRSTKSTSTLNQKQPCHCGRPASSHTAVDCSLKLYDIIDLINYRVINLQFTRSVFRTDQTDHRYQ